MPNPAESIDPTDLAAACKRLGISFDELGVVIVDHGSRRRESNLALLEVVRFFQRATPYRFVEPAHMELAEPSIEQAFSKLAQAGVKFAVVHPYFLLPGRHWAEDIPRLAFAASTAHGINHLVTAPLGIHSLMSQIMHERIHHCLQHVTGLADACDLCAAEGGCREREAR